jgi:hypothetical protein
MQFQAAPSGPLPIALPSTGAMVQRQGNGLRKETVPAELCVCRATQRTTNAPQIAIAVRSLQVPSSAVDNYSARDRPALIFLFLFWVRVRVILSAASASRDRTWQFYNMPQKTLILARFSLAEGRAWAHGSLELGNNNGLGTGHALDRHGGRRPAADFMR